VIERSGRLRPALDDVDVIGGKHDLTFVIDDLGALDDTTPLHSPRNT
jgi:hypothetical protein